MGTKELLFLLTKVSCGSLGKSQSPRLVTLCKSTGLFNRIIKGFPKFPFCYKGIYSCEEATREVKLEDLVGPFQQSQKSLLDYEEH